jgi:hypothetical protein
MRNPAVQHGANVGAGIMLLLVAVLCLSIYIFHSRDSLSVICFTFFFLGFLLGILGYIIGGIGASYASVPRAFFFGGIIGVFASAFIFCIAVVPAANSDSEFHIFVFAIVLTSIFSSTGALIAGFGGIAARDYRRFKKVRIFPQFTLQELLIVISLVAVILSAITSWSFVQRC